MPIRANNSFPYLSDCNQTAADIRRCAELGEDLVRSVSRSQLLKRVAASSIRNAKRDAVGFRHTLGLTTGFTHRRNRWAVRGCKNAVFVWVPKTAGTSVERTLEAFGGRKFKTLEDVRFAFPQAGVVTFGHMDYERLVDDGLVTRRFHESAFRFAVVRDPRDRAISLYEHLRRGNYIPTGTSFRAFAQLLADGAVTDIGLFNARPRELTNCNPQAAWILGRDGKPLVDHIARFERLDELCEVLSGKLGTVSDIPKLRVGKRRDYSDYFSDRRVNTLIEEFYSVDFEAFGYE
ncbi:sulfotransferase family protein [Acidimicrobiales bacterium]|nr:sulfotransferase family protein [bacterium]MDB4205935.1 sulfotransferase family protein [bacterium]MDC1390521.1 sulfotransferase family protein [Acidimicrobiales bacterium]